MGKNLTTIIDDLSGVLDSVDKLDADVPDYKVRTLIRHSYDHLDDAFKTLNILCELQSLLMTEEKVLGPSKEPIHDYLSSETESSPKRNHRGGTVRRRRRRQKA